LAGLLSAGYEVSALYDPSTPLCAMDVQPFTYPEFPEGIPKALDKLLESRGRAYVVVRGTLWGPAPALDEDASQHPVVDYARRVARSGYGHGSWLRTKIVVDEVVAVRPVPRDVPPIGDLLLRPAGPPALSSAALPSYPVAARQAGVVGDVVVEATVKGGRVVDVAVVSGDRMLTAGVLQNVRTWTFAADVDGKLTSTFSFSLELRQTGAGRGDRLELDLPRSAKIIGAKDLW
jgi:TonB family protein